MDTLSHFVLWVGEVWFIDRLPYKRQNLESFLDAIIRTIRYFGGTPRKFIFDNAKVAVKSGFGAHAIAQDDYKQLSAHYGFEPVFCNPASGNEKGLVENLVGYIRRNVCVPLPRVNSLEELNVKLLEKCVEYLNHQVEGRPAKVGVMLEEERCALQPMPTYTPDISKKVYPKNNRTGYKGVSVNKATGKFEAHICSDNRDRYLGLFSSGEEAAEAYDAASRILHGEFGCVNFPQPGEQSCEKAAI